MKKRSLWFWAFLIIGACSQPSPLTVDEQKAIIADIRQTMDNYYRDIKASGLTAEFSYLDSSSNFFWVPPGYASAISYDSVAFILHQNAPLYTSIDNTLDTIRIIPLNREFATYTARLQSAMTDTAGVVSKFSLIETGLFVKRKNGWKLLSGQTSIINN